MEFLEYSETAHNIGVCVPWTVLLTGVVLATIAMLILAVRMEMKFWLMATGALLITLGWGVMAANVNLSGRAEAMDTYRTVAQQTYGISLSEMDVTKLGITGVKPDLPYVYPKTTWNEGEVEVPRIGKDGGISVVAIRAAYDGEHLLLGTFNPNNVFTELPRR
ncbi:hypothetical protein [Microbacterium sp. 77mftsu3.1]|uniref:hypothetical protein n=1 Tax=Microbacterium sp. 77mftsu3.1 TaxID=1761802 RepID=UPI000363D877|nr:hypothetical protein [Microbacterium sp. 77mftsu3.1]SDH41697.1 hypothetical protein SAMN04488590_3287 [Microbacterium sp. 77mftsu3.1]